MENQTDLLVKQGFSLSNGNHSISEVGVNGSSVAVPADNWNFSAIFTLTVCVVVLLLNSIVLMSLLRDESLRKQPFCVYITCLLVSNILYAVMENPLEILTHVRSVWSFGVTWCIMYKYALSCVVNAQMFSHVLISLSRGWAVSFPHSYRQNHTWKCALLLCAAMLAYSHVVHLPRFIPKMANLKLPLEVYGCNSQYRPNTPQVYLTFASAFGIVIAAYPFIVCMRKKRIQSQNQVGSTNPTTERATKNLPSKKIVSDVLAKRAQQKAQHGSQSFLVLTMMTCSILIFWAPAAISYAVLCFMPVPYPLLFQVAMTLLAVQPAMDPILFTVAMKDLRSKFMGKFCCKSN